jgi:hypothetical protein
VESRFLLPGSCNSPRPSRLGFLFPQKREQPGLNEIHYGQTANRWTLKKTPHLLGLNVRFQGGGSNHCFSTITTKVVDPPVMAGMKTRNAESYKTDKADQ